MYSIFLVSCPEEIKLLYSSQVGFIQWRLLVQTRTTPIFYLFWTANMKYTVVLELVKYYDCVFYLESTII